MRLLRALSSLVSRSPKDGGCTTSSGQPVPIFGWPLRGKFSPCSHCKTRFHQHLLVASCLTEKCQAPSSWWACPSSGNVTVMPPQGCLFPRLNKPSATLPRASAAAPWPWPSTELSLSCFWWPKTEHSTQTWLNKYWVNVNNHFPSPADCSPLTAARDTPGSCPACGPPGPLGPFLRAAPHHSVPSLGSLHPRCRTWHSS